MSAGGKRKEERVKSQRQRDSEIALEEEGRARAFEEAAELLMEKAIDMFRGNWGQPNELRELSYHFSDVARLAWTRRAAILQELLKGEQQS